ncbi:MAG: transposase [Planctomycetaceae bacterium]|nr:transposase [Planctomycetaceae bacterium]
MERRRHRRNYNVPGQAHELTFSCYRRFRFLQAERTCQWLAESLGEARSEWRFDLWAYVFMPDHAHVILRPRETDYDIADIRKAIKSPVGQQAIRHLEEHAPEWLPRITRRRGTEIERLFWHSGGGYDRNITDGKTLLKMIDYVHNNPVRARLVERARDWRWSSAAWYADQSPIPIPVDPIPPEWSSDVGMI